MFDSQANRKPCSPAHRRSEIEHFVRASGAIALIVPETARDHDYRDMAAEVAAACPHLRHVLVDGSPGSGQRSAIHDSSLPMSCRSRISPRTW